MAWKNKIIAKAQDELVDRTASLHLPCKVSPPHEESTPSLNAPSTAKPDVPSDPPLHTRSMTSSSLPLPHDSYSDTSLHRISTDPTPYPAAPPPYSSTPSPSPPSSSATPPPKKPHKTLARIHSFKTTIEDSAALSIYSAAKAGSKKAPQSFMKAEAMTAVTGPVPSLAFSTGYTAYKVGGAAYKTYKIEEKVRAERLVKDGKAYLDEGGKLVMVKKGKEKEEEKVSVEEGGSDSGVVNVVVEKEKTSVVIVEKE